MTYKHFIDIHMTTDMSEFDLIQKIDASQTKNLKKGGVVYTPPHIAISMVNMCQPTPDMMILEPSCGHGVFLFALLNYMEKSHELKGESLLFWFLKNVHAIDISSTTIKDLTELLSHFFAKKHGVKCESFTNLICHDALTYQTTTKYDLVIGNPPYIRTKNLNNEYLKWLRTEFSSCEKGNVDIYYAFVEKYCNESKQCCFIVPNSFLNNVSGKTLFTIIKDRLSTLIDFKENLIFTNARVYTCIVHTKSKNDGIIKYGYNFEKLNSTHVDTFNKQSHRVILDSDTQVLSGIATLCDKVFMVKKKDKKYYAIFNSNEYEIEEDIVIPYVKITKLHTKTNSDYIIYPYDRNRNIINEDVMKYKYPKTYSYLTRCFTLLSNRDKGKTNNYDAWYAYGRKQGLHHIADQWMVMIPQLIGGVCKPIKISKSMVASSFDNFVFTSGYVIPQNENNEDVCELILGVQFLDFAKQNGKPWPGKEESYYSLTTKQIKQFISIYQKSHINKLFVIE